MDNKNELVVINYDATEYDIQTSNPLGDKNKKNRNLKTWIIVLACVLLAFMVLTLFLINEQYKRELNIEEFYKGIYIDDIDVGGKTKDEALLLLNKKHGKQELGKIVTVVYEDNEYTFTERDVSVFYDNEEIIDKAYSVARYGSNVFRYIELKKIERENVKFYTQKNVNLAPIQKDIFDIAIRHQKELEQEKVIFRPDLEVDKAEWFTYIDVVYGVDIDEELLWNNVVDAFLEAGNHIVEVPHKIIKPSETIDLRSITKPIASFKSKQVRNSNRQYNVDLACAAINGTVLMPGEVFSMNEATGERTLAKGYKEANVIVGGNELIPGVAGGVCQVSGTLYNAVFRANLEVVERHHHSFELSYLKRGTDSTVHYGLLDLKFKNNYEYPIYISMYAVGLDVYADIFGAKPSEYDYIDMYVKTRKTIPVGEPVYIKDSSVPAGSEPVHISGRKGITCDVYKVFYDADGEEVNREKVYRDVYKHYSPEIRVNPLDYEFYINPEKFNYDIEEYRNYYNQ